VSMREISIAVRAQNQASGVFRTVAQDVVNLGVSFGALDSQAGRMVMQVFSVVRLMNSLKAILATTTPVQSAYNASAAAGAGVQTTLAVSTSGAMSAQVAQNTATQTGIVSQTLHAVRLGVSSAAHAVYSAACGAATVAANALNISTATFLALTGVGIAVIAAAAVAMWSFANSMNSATASVRNFNSTAAETPSRTRSIQRAGEEATVSSRGNYATEAVLYRRGVE
jgi:hypothetical protein